MATIQTTSKKKIEPIPCNCKKCTNWNGAKKGCRLGIQGRIKNGKCLHFGTYKTDGYTLTKEEKAAIRAHNKAVDASKAAAKMAETPVVMLATLQRACDASYLTMAYLRKCKQKTRIGNGRYEIECIEEEPLTIKIKGLKGARKPYIVKE